MDEIRINVKEFVEQIKQGKSLVGPDGIFSDLIKRITEAALDSELEVHLNNPEERSSRNRRNGRSSKTLKSSVGGIDIETPRDRNSTFEPQFVKKYQTSLTPEMESKILALYANGMSYRDIQEHINDIYGYNVSPATITAVTDKVLESVKEWQGRYLESMYAFVWLDAIHYKVKIGGTYITKAVYTILGIRMDGCKEVLGMYISESEGASFWLTVLTDLQNRGVKDILIACVDGLRGFPEAISSVFPKTEIQLCVIHQIRNSLKYIPYRDQKEFMKDLKQVYQAVNKEIGEMNLVKLEEKWGRKYPLVLRQWKDKWEHLSNYFRYSEGIRRMIYTTNAIESLHRQFRKVTKTKGAFPNDESLLKLLFMCIKNVSKKWTTPVRDWKSILSQITILFGDRLEKQGY